MQLGNNINANFFLLLIRFNVVIEVEGENLISHHYYLQVLPRRKDS